MVSSKNTFIAQSASKMIDFSIPSVLISGTHMHKHTYTNQTLKNPVKVLPSGHGYKPFGSNVLLLCTSAVCTPPNISYVSVSCVLCMYSICVSVKEKRDCLLFSVCVLPKGLANPLLTGTRLVVFRPYQQKGLLPSSVQHIQNIF